MGSDEGFSKGRLSANVVPLGRGTGRGLTSGLSVDSVVSADCRMYVVCVHVHALQR